MRLCAAALDKINNNASTVQWWRKTAVIGWCGNSNEMVIETEIKIGRKYRFLSQKIDEVVTITESPIKNSSGFLEYGARNKDGVYRICFNDELFKLETSDSTYL